MCILTHFLPVDNFIFSGIIKLAAIMTSVLLFGFPIIKRHAIIEKTMPIFLFQTPKIIFKNLVPKVQTDSVAQHTQPQEEQHDAEDGDDQRAGTFPLLSREVIEL